MLKTKEAPYIVCEPEKKSNLFTSTVQICLRTLKVCSNRKCIICMFSIENILKEGNTVCLKECLEYPNSNFKYSNLT